MLLRCIPFSSSGSPFQLLSRSPYFPRPSRYHRTIMTSGSPWLSLPPLPIFKALSAHDPQKTAIIHSASGKRFTYGQLLDDTARGRVKLARMGESKVRGETEGEEQKMVSFLVENGYDYVVTLLAIWASGGIAVPLCTSHPPQEMRYVINDSKSDIVLASRRFEGTMKMAMEVGVERREEIREHVVERHIPQGKYERVELEGEMDSEKEAMIIYTSGTTSLPKGVLTTHKNITAQSTALLQAWKYSDKDHLLHILPLHHVHGIINATITPLLAGSTIEYLFPFSSQSVLSRLSSPFLPSASLTNNAIASNALNSKEKITLLMAVPTIYSRLIAHYHQKLSEEEKAATTQALSNLRLTVSGSAALPAPTKHAWSNISSNQVILERYGMTEIGMALSCGLDPATERMDNSVGWPLPEYEVRLVDLDTGEVVLESTPSAIEQGQGQYFTASGEIQIRGPGVFTRYHNRPAEVTGKEFTSEESDPAQRWFKTGDVAVRDVQTGAYYIKGRKSVDIIKTGGEKVSALEIEREILLMDEIKEVAVLGIPDPDWGQMVVAVVVLGGGVAERGGEKEVEVEVRKYLKGRLAGYKVPKVVKVLEGGIKRNAMGKVNKKQLGEEIFRSSPTTMIPASQEKGDGSILGN